MQLLQSLSRGLAALDYLAAAGESVRLTDVALHLQVEKPNATHLLKTLVVAGYAEQVEGRRYRATAKVRRSESPTLNEVVWHRDRLHEVLESLVAETGECAHLAVLVGERVWYVDKVDSPSPLRVDHPVGSLAPLHCTALGKAFLTFGRATHTSPLQAYTARTLVDSRGLEDEIERTRMRGYAIDDEEYTVGIRCVAVPVRDAQGRMVAACGVSGPTSRMGVQRMAQVGDLLMQAPVSESAD